MTYTVTIDHQRCLVSSTWVGHANAPLLFAYVNEVWLNPSVQAYAELLDFRQVSGVDVETDQLHSIAKYSRTLDNSDSQVRTAVVAEDQLVFGLSRMFASIRAMDPDDRREFRVFSTMDEARAWLAG